jgi:hypothetical protein
MLNVPDMLSVIFYPIDGHGVVGHQMRDTRNQLATRPLINVTMPACAQQRQQQFSF